METETMSFDTPQDVEDAFYDALEAGSPEAMVRVWETSDDIACLLPMTPLIRGAAVIDMWRTLLGPGISIDIQTRHLGWIQCGDMAIHLIEERVVGGLHAQGSAPGRAMGEPPPIYATKVYRRGADGWRLVLHQSSPTPPPTVSAPSGPGGLHSRS